MITPEQNQHVCKGCGRVFGVMLNGATKVTCTCSYCGTKNVVRASTAKVQQKITCMCCGKTSVVNLKKSEFPNRTSYIECGHCHYEHRAEIRANKIVYITTA